MISFITNLLRAVFFGYLLNDYLKSRYPKKYETFIISFSYNLIYVYSKVQIFYMNIVKTVNKKIEETPKLLKLKNDLDLLLNKKNGTVIMIECIKNGILSDNLSMTECDFALYSRLDDSKSCLNKKIVYDPEYNALTNPVLYQSPNIIIPNPSNNDNTQPNTVYYSPPPPSNSSSSPAYQS